MTQPEDTLLLLDDGELDPVAAILERSGLSYRRLRGGEIGEDLAPPSALLITTPRHADKVRPGSPAGASPDSASATPSSETMRPVSEGSVCAISISRAQSVAPRKFSTTSTSPGTPGTRRAVGSPAALSGPAPGGAPAAAVSPDAGPSGRCAGVRPQHCL